MPWVAAGCLMVGCIDGRLAAHPGVETGFGDGGAPDVAGGAPDAGMRPPTELDGGTEAPGRRDAGRDAGSELGPDAGLDMGGDGAAEPLLVVAFGHGGRTMVSCDRGRTWVANHFVVGDADDWGHNEWTARELVAQGGWFFAASGWGTPKLVRRSRNGVSWEDALARGEGGDTWSGVATPGAVLLGQANRGQRSVDGGAHWEPFAPPGHGKGLYAYGAGTTLVVSLGSARVVARSEDEGGNWAAVQLSAEAEACLDGAHAPVHAGAVFLFGSRAGSTCVSDDRGRSWRVGAPIPGGSVTSLARSGATVRAYGAGGVFETADGRAWASLGPAPRLAEVTGNAEFGFVGLVDGAPWASSDGVRWAEAEYPREGPPLRHLAVGAGTRPAACPPSAGPGGF